MGCYKAKPLKLPSERSINIEAGDFLKSIPCILPFPGLGDGTSCPLNALLKNTGSSKCIRIDLFLQKVVLFEETFMLKSVIGHSFWESYNPTPPFVGTVQRPPTCTFSPFVGNVQRPPTCTLSTFFFKESCYFYSLIGACSIKYRK